MELKTYINSGNVIFKTMPNSQTKLAAMIEKTIQENFGFTVKVLVRDFKNIQSIAKVMPESWKNDQTMKCDVMFLWEEINDPNIVKKLAIKRKLKM